MLPALRKVGQVRLLCFDLENKPGAYWYDGETTSIITAFGWKWSDERRVHTLMLLPNGDFLDSEGREMPGDMAYQLFSGELAEAGLVYGHNIRRHDLPMLNANLLRRELPTLRPLLTSDTAKDLPKRAGVSVSLENLVSMYGLPGRKQTMTQPEWEDANQLTEAGIERARRRAASDVLLQERLRKRLLELGLLKAPRVWAP